MASLLLLTNAMSPSAEVLPALGLLGALGAHRARSRSPRCSTRRPHDAVLVDARRDLAGARSAVPAAAHDRA